MTTIFLETERLILAAPSVDDFEREYLLQSDSDVMRYIGRGVRTEDEVRAGLQKAVNHYAKHGFSLGDMFEKGSGNFIGRAGIIYLQYDDTQPDIEIAFALLKRYWGKGYATEIAQGLLDWGFANLPVTKLVGVAQVANERSRKVLEKVGMHYVSMTKYNDQEVAYYEIMRPGHE